MKSLPENDLKRPQTPISCNFLPLGVNSKHISSRESSSKKYMNEELISQLSYKRFSHNQECDHMSINLEQIKDANNISKN